MSKMTLSERLKQVDEFALIMKERIIEEEHAGRDEWDTWTIAQLLVRVVECTAEVFSAVSGGLSPTEISHACANLANYSLIVSHGVQTRGLHELVPIIAPSSK